MSDILFSAYNNWTFQNTDFRLFDVGGQRSQRMKWAHLFDEAKAVIFLAALSEYGFMLREDCKINRMTESLKLFASVCNNHFLQQANMILFLNKSDVFEAKISDPEGTPLSFCFPEYKGNLKSIQETSHFIKHQFQKLNADHDRIVYTHFTCATNTNNVGFIFSAISEMLISEWMKDCALY